MMTSGAYATPIPPTDLSRLTVAVKAVNDTAAILRLTQR